MLRTGHKARNDKDDKFRVADNSPENLIFTLPRTPFAQVS